VLLSLVEVTRELGTWAYILLAFLVLVEGPIATLAGAVAAAAGLMNPVGVFAAATTGNLLADSLWYTVGYLGKLEWLERYGGWVGVRRSHVHRFRLDIQQNAGRLVFFAKLTLGFIVPVLVATGLSRVPLRRWAPGLIGAEIVWTGLLVFLGFHFGNFVQTLERGVEWVVLVSTLTCVALLIVYLSRLRKRTITGEGT
jgi:membrane protein DedA with SNARE-associated domain